MKELSEITFDLSTIESGLSLIVNERMSNTLFEIEDAEENGETMTNRFKMYSMKEAKSTTYG